MSNHESLRNVRGLVSEERRKLRILAISGSLRATSTNTVLLNSAAALAPENVDVVVYRGLGTLPHFNPDLDHDPVPGPVIEFRSQVRISDGIVFSTPVYAHGIPGVLKNALDWLVPGVELHEKPVALFNASSRSTCAQASLAETLKVMSARMILEASITVPLLGRDFDEGATVMDSDVCRVIRSGMAALVSAICRSADLQDADLQDADLQADLGMAAPS